MIVSAGRLHSSFRFRGMRNITRLRNACSQVSQSVESHVESRRRANRIELKFNRCTRKCATKMRAYVYACRFRREPDKGQKRAGK